MIFVALGYVYIIIPFLESKYEELKVEEEEEKNRRIILKNIESEKGKKRDNFS
jgi:hypothetical protein